jgi:DNA-binding CsgD family transcriptional regulator
MREFLRDVFAANQLIILSVYGQVFFALALAIALQSWRHSRLALARNLHWLAAFGLTHALYEWGDVFIPLQEQYMVGPLIDFLRSAQSVLLAVSFACLFQFGIETQRPLPGRWRLLRYLPTAALLAWVGWAFGPALALARELAHWHITITIWARYGLGFPGAVVAAYGLWHQARLLATDLQMPQVLRTLRLAALALAGYSIVAGLVVRPGPFFPASALNTRQLENLVLVPVPVFRGALRLILAVAIIHSLAEHESYSAAFQELSERELEVLALIAEGKTNAEIAAVLVLSEKTARNHVSTILEKLALSNRIEAPTYAVRHHIERFLPERSSQWSTERKPTRAPCPSQPRYRQHFGRLNVGTRALSSLGVAWAVKRALTALDVDTTAYSGHSLRSGLVTAAAMAGVSERVIMRQTGHKNTATAQISKVLSQSQKHNDSLKIYLSRS